MRVLRWVGIVLLLLAVLVLVRWLDRGRAASVPPPAQIEVVAHRGVHTNWIKGAYDPIVGCEAKHLYPPNPEIVARGLIENTLESIGAAFDYGATVVEIDIRRTADGHLVIYHDSLLECRTNGEGAVEEQTLDSVKSLDIGYGYTADGGQTYPFRGLGVGRMPTLLEVLNEYPERRFLIDHKDASAQTAALLGQTLAPLPAAQRARLHYWGSPENLAVVQAHAPEVTRLIASRGEMKAWLIPYLATLGFAPIPEESRGLVLGIPAAYTRFVWGWPWRFLQRAHAAGAQVYVLIDTAADAKRFHDLPVDGVITDSIEVVGPAFN